MKPIRAILLLALLLPACTLGPDYQRPRFLCVFDWKQGKGDSSAQVPDEWWRLYQDKTLNRLVTEALAANPTLDAARARVEQSRALVGLSRASLFPALNLTGGASTRRFAQDVMGSQLPAGFNVPLERDAYQANLELGYELDLWGAHRRGREAAAAEAEAAQAMLAWQRLGLAGEVTRHHLLRQGLLRQQRLLGQILKARERSLAMLEERQRAGLIDRLQLNQAQTQVELARNDLSAVERQLESAGHALAVLCGKAPAGFDAGKLIATHEAPELRPGLPSTLLNRRPDLYAAEQRLRAANARIGVAEAAFYPNFNLLASGGYESVNPANFLEWRNRIFSLGAGLTAPVFKGGANRAAWEQSVASRDEELANYRTAWLEALKQVEDALVDLRQLSLACDALKQASEKSRASLDTLRERQEKGLADELEVIEAEVSSMRMELLWIECEANQRISFAALAKALGGGWVAP